MFPAAIIRECSAGLVGVGALSTSRGCLAERPIRPRAADTERLRRHMGQEVIQTPCPKHAHSCRALRWASEAC